MSVEKVTNPVTREAMLLASGIVDGIYINPLKEVKTYAGPNGDWTPNASINLVVGGTKVSLGLTDKEVVRAKDVEGNYQDLTKGSEVSVIVEENGEYKGVKQYQSRSSAVTIINHVPAQAQGSVPQQPYKPKDNSGIIAGNAFNAAKALLQGQDFTVEQFTETAKQLMAIGQELVKELTESNPELSAYDVGARSGMALIAACEWVSDIADVKEQALSILADYLPELNAHAKEILEGNKVEAAPKKAVKKAPAKRAPKEEVEPVDDADIPAESFDDLDDTLPF